MNQENNFNSQGNNGMPNNQPLNQNQVVGYDSQTGQPIYASQNNSLDDKLLMAFIGNNYEKIMQQKFSIPALFLSWIYTLYRRIYLPSIIGMVAIIILGFLPSIIYTILVLAFVIVLGINFNKWYVAYAKKQVEKIKMSNQNINENELINICKKKGGTNIWLAILIYAIFAIASGFLNPNIAKQYNNLDVLTNNDIEEINDFFEKYQMPKVIVNTDEDFRLDNGLKLNNKENVKLVTDSIMQLVMSNNINTINEYHLLSMLAAGNVKDEFHISVGVCFKKNYLINKNKEYFYDKTIDFDNLENSLTNYYCSTGIGNFGGIRPIYDSTIEIDNGLKLIYKKEGTFQSIITFTYLLDDNLYKLYKIENEPNLENYIGNWHVNENINSDVSTGNDELSIKMAENKIITFDYNLSGLCGEKNISVEINNNIGEFKTLESIGTIEFRDNTVVLKIKNVNYNETFERTFIILK